MTELHTLLGLVLLGGILVGFLKILNESPEVQMIIGLATVLLGGMISNTFGNTTGGGIIILFGILFLALGFKKAFRI